VMLLLLLHYHAAGAQPVVARPRPGARMGALAFVGLPCGRVRFPDGHVRGVHPARFPAAGGLDQKRYAWGDELMPDGKHRCNIWQGTFPSRNTRADGYLSTAPVDAYEPNGFGLYNVCGNVWEWCNDWWTSGPHPTENVVNPTGPRTGDARVMRGGSYLCHKSYCNRYRVAARTANTPDSSTGNMGFRVAADVA